MNEVREDPDSSVEICWGQDHDYVNAYWELKAKRFTLRPGRDPELHLELDLGLSPAKLAGSARQCQGRGARQCRGRGAHPCSHFVVPEGVVIMIRLTTRLA